MVIDLVILGLGIALQPFRLSAFILILTTKGGTKDGLGFILGWLACLVLVIAVVVVITGGSPVRFHRLPATVVQIAKLALGIALIAIAAVQSRKRGRPRILTILRARLDTMSPWTAAAVAAIMQPWTLVAAGAITVAQAAGWEHPRSSTCRTRRTRSSGGHGGWHSISRTGCGEPAHRRCLRRCTGTRS